MTLIYYKHHKIFHKGPFNVKFKMIITYQLPMFSHIIPCIPHKISM